MNFKEIEFPYEPFEELIKSITGQKLNEWIKFWEKEKEIFATISEFYGKNFKQDWLWGLILPLFSDIYFLKKYSSKKIVIGLSALPGTGKTTLGLLIEKISIKMNIKLTVVSMDDYYLPFDEMNIAIKNNPWNVSRGFPGSHSTNLIEESILEWKNTGRFKHPVFDKSLRNGLGDRTGWRITFPEIILLEGWFLGVKPSTTKNVFLDEVEPPLFSNEIAYRSKIQNNLVFYFKTWELIDRIWQIKPEKFIYMNKWKEDQEKEMFKKKGNALLDEELSNFQRMLNCSIPQTSFNDIDINYKVVLNENRGINWVGLKI